MVIKSAFFIFFITFCSASIADIKEFVRDYDYVATDYDSKYTSRINAIDGVKRELIEELGTYIKSIVNIKEDSYGNKYARQDIVTISAGITQLVLLDENWDRVRYYIKALMKADPEDVIKQVNSIRDNYHVEDQLRNTLEELNKTRDLVKDLQLQLTASQEDKNVDEKLVRQYANAVTTIEVQQVFQKAMKAILFEGDFTTEFTLLKQLAGRGSADAMVKIGLLYDRGLGVKQDYNKAREWYQKAIQKNHAGGYSLMGFLYERGRGVDQSFIVAIDYFKKAINLDSVGSAMAMAKLGGIYEKGTGVEKNTQIAKKLYQDSLAKKPNGVAYAFMGRLYFNGEIGYDFEKAVSLFEKGVALGNPLCMAFLGRMYMQGKGVDRDMDRALELFNRAERRGHGLASAYLGIMYMKGLGVDKDRRLAFKKFKAAADFGSPLGYRMLGIAYKKGVGVLRNKYKAEKWLKKAAERGDKRARKILDSMF